MIVIDGKNLQKIYLLKGDIEILLEVREDAQNVI